MTSEDFARWLEDPVTRAVIAAHRQVAEDNRTAWVDASWNNGVASPNVLLELKTRADAYMAITEMTYFDVMAALGEEPREE